MTLTNAWEKSKASIERLIEKSESDLVPLHKKHIRAVSRDQDQMKQKQDDSTKTNDEIWLLM